MAAVFSTLCQHYLQHRGLAEGQFSARSQSAGSLYRRPHLTTGSFYCSLFGSHLVAVLPHLFGASAVLCTPEFDNVDVTAFDEHPGSLITRYRIMMIQEGINKEVRRRMFHESKREKRERKLEERLRNSQKYRRHWEYWKMGPSFEWRPRSGKTDYDSDEDNWEFNVDDPFYC